MANKGPAGARHLAALKLCDNLGVGLLNGLLLLEQLLAHLGLGIRVEALAGLVDALVEGIEPVEGRGRDDDVGVGVARPHAQQVLEVGHALLHLTAGEAAL